MFLPVIETQRTIDFLVGFTAQVKSTIAKFGPAFTKC